MNIKVILLSLLFFCIATVGQAQEINVDLYQEKAERYKGMKRTGFTLAGIGGVSSIIGIAMMSSADWNQESNGHQTNYTTEDGSGVGGLLLTAIGIPITVTGFILGGIGSKKEKEYRSKLNNLSFNVIPTSRSTSFRLAYTF